jgi:hypothetical protein
MMLLRFCISGVLMTMLCHATIAQNDLLLIEHAILHTSMTNPTIQNTQADVLVLDGHIIKKKDRALEQVETVRRLLLTDYTALQKLGIEDSLRTYEFFETEKTALYSAIYMKVRHDIPWNLWDMSIPVLVNGKLKESLKDIQINEIQNVTYIAQQDLDLNVQQQVLYGAISIQKKQ